MNMFAYYEHSLQLIRSGLCMEKPAHCAAVFRQAKDGLILSAMHQPARHLTGYMNRYWLLSPEQCEQDDLPFFGVRIHHILRPDIGRDCHNHPWMFRSFILSGGYQEALLVGDKEQLQTVSAGDTYLRTKADYHRIVSIDSEPLWTLCVLMKRDAKDWGFMTDTGHVDSDSYRHLNR